MDDKTAAKFLESLYRSFHHPGFIDPDPLGMVLQVGEEDREIAALIASAYSLGRVGLILQVLKQIFSKLRLAEGGVKQRILLATDAQLETMTRGISYRFFRPEDLKNLLVALRDLYARHGSPQTFFQARNIPDQPPAAKHLLEWYRESPVMTGLRDLHKNIHSGRHDLNPMFFPDPSGNGACKRFHLFMRWMVREDAIDPGGWKGIHPGQLWIPLDTHVLRHSQKLGLTSRKQADARAVAEVTAGFRRMIPEDPCRYDFSLSRMGINPEASSQENIIYASLGGADRK